MASPYWKYAGTLEGRILPENADAQDGDYVFVLGSDQSPLPELMLQVGDFVQVEQAFDMTGVDLVRFRLKMRTGDNPPSRNIVTAGEVKFYDGVTNTGLVETGDALQGAEVLDGSGEFAQTDQGRYVRISGTTLNDRDRYIEAVPGGQGSAVDAGARALLQRSVPPETASAADLDVLGSRWVFQCLIDGSEVFSTYEEAETDGWQRLTLAAHVSKLTGSHTLTFKIGLEATYNNVVTQLQLEVLDMPSPKAYSTSAYELTVDKPDGALGNNVDYKLQDGAVYQLKNSQSLDLTASGIGGLDTGTEATSTWYYIYLVPDSGELKGILSVTDPASGGPTGYTNFLPVMAVYNDSAGDLRQCRTSGRDIMYTENVRPTNTFRITSYQATAAAFDISDAIPVCAEAARCEVESQHGSTTGYTIWTDVHEYNHLIPETGTTQSSFWTIRVGAAFGHYGIDRASGLVPTPNGAQQIGVRCFSDGGTGAHLMHWSVEVRGYRDQYRF